MMAILKRHLRHAAFALSVILVSSSARGQFNPMVPLIPAQPVPDEQQDKADKDQKADQKSKQEAAQKEAQKKQQEQQFEQQIQQKIQQFNCDRRPSAVLKVWATPPEDEDKDEDEDDEEKEQADAEEDEADSAGAPSAPPTAPPTVMRPGMAMRIVNGRPVPIGRPRGAHAAVDKETAKKLKQFDELLKKLGRHITLGEWPDVKQLLAEIESKKHNKALYLRILDSLAMASRSSMPIADMGNISAEQQVMMMAAMKQGRNAQMFPETNLISIPDFVDLVKAAPCELADALPKLGRLLRNSLAAGSVLDELMSQLQADPPLVPKREAAKMLSAAGEDEQLGEFLPTIEEATEQNDREALNLLSRYYLAKNSREPKTEHLEQAWHVNQAVLAVGEVSKEEKQEALRRAVELVPKVKEDLSQAWLTESFRERPERGKEILAAIGEACGQSLRRYAHQAAERQRLLEMQSTAVKLLVESSREQTENWRDALNLLAQNWMREANISLRFDRSDSFGPQMQRDPYGNIFYINNQSMEPNQHRDRKQPRPIPIAAVLETRPQDSWHDLLEPSIQSKFDMTSSRLFLRVNEPEQAFPYIERMAENYPRRAKELAEEFLRVWAKNHNPNQERNRTSYYMFNWGYSNRAERIPLTRSKQNRNLEELAGWAARLKQLPIEDFDENLLVEAFMTSHSEAEVFQLAAIEGVFGSLDDLQPETLASFAQRMRANLATLWQMPAVQKKNNTNRKQKDIQLEVQRGYRTAAGVIEKGLKSAPDNWQLRQAAACLAHDRNDYANELQKSSEFANNRKAALAMFAAAAQRYAKTAEDLAEEEQSVDVYEKWFYASLGAPDVGRVRHESVPILAEIEQIRSAIDALPKPLPEHHLTLFANNMFSRMSAVDPSCKFRYLREGFKIVGDHKQAHEAKKVFDYYNDLVSEIKLAAEIDGMGNVGYDEPFGLFVNIRHTKEIERESGGFARYLQNQNQGSFYNYGRPTENYRDKFEEAAVAALDEHFEVLSVTFNKADVHSKAVSEYGWRVTPYAYLLLKARGPEVDQIPALRLDLDFLDTSGYAVLPVETSLMPINAKSTDILDGPENLEIVQTLDERQAAEGKLILEIKATARGLLPKLDEVLDVGSDGFHITDTDDQGVSVVEFDDESDETAIKSERLWLITMEADTSQPVAAKSFSFASNKLEGVKSTYQRFVDADLEETESVVALERNYAHSHWRWVWRALIIAMLGIGACLIYMQLRSRKPTEETVAYKIPEKVTPFTAINLLKHIYSTNGLKPIEKQQLSSAIDRLESHYFAEPNGAEPDLEQVMRDWIEKTQG